MLKRILTHILETQTDGVVSIRAASGDSFQTLSLLLRMYSKKNPLLTRPQRPPRIHTAPSDDKAASRKETFDLLALMLD